MENMLGSWRACSDLTVREQRSEEDSTSWFTTGYLDKGRGSCSMDTEETEAVATK